MEGMLLEIVLIVVGIAVVLWGADRFTDGASGLARRLKVSELVIGLTVVALGTSLPEFMVSFMSVLRGSSDMSVGNILGSNIFNILVILGVSAIMRPMVVEKTLLRRDLPLCFATSVLLVLFALTGGTIARWEGLLLVAFFCTYLFVAYRIAVKDRKGQEVSLSEYQGKVLLIVNTATGCGFTPHYEPLEAMYKEMRDKGFEILDFPSNQFANQAPGSDDEIHEFCTLKFGTEFPQFAKIDVNGEEADPLFAFLASEKPFKGFGKDLKNAALNKFAAMNYKKYGEKTYIGWNFTKFLVDREGKVVARFEPTTDMREVRAAVAEQLEK